MSWTPGPWEALLTSWTWEALLRRPSAGPPTPLPSRFGQSAHKAPTSQGGCLFHILASTGQPPHQRQQLNDLMFLFPPASISLPTVHPTFYPALPNPSQPRQENMISNSFSFYPRFIPWFGKYHTFPFLCAPCLPILLKHLDFSVHRCLCSRFSLSAKGGWVVIQNVAWMKIQNDNEQEWHPASA